MNIDPSPEEIKNATFKIESLNDTFCQEVGKDLSWVNQTHFKIDDCKNITQRDLGNQFGLSLKIAIEGVDYFLKLPPGPSEKGRDVNVDIIKKHYLTMAERFKAEFAKLPTFEFILKRCKNDLFTIARPLALCNTLMTLANGDVIELPGLLYVYVKDGEDLTKTDSWRTGNKDGAAFLAFAKGLTRIVQVIHNQGVLHSFLVPRNIIKTKKANNTQYVIVGFGYSSFCDSKHHTPSNVSDADRCYRAPECEQKDNLGAMWFPVDIYSIGAILYEFATNEKPDDPLPRDVNRLKEHIYNILSEPSLNNLFNDNENILKILDRCLSSLLI